MPEILAELSKYPIKTRLKLKRNTDCCKRYAHAKIKKLLDAGKPMPEYFKITQFITRYPKPRRNAKWKFRTYNREEWMFM